MASALTPQVGPRSTGPRPSTCNTCVYPRRTLSSSRQPAESRTPGLGAAQGGEGGLSGTTQCALGDPQQEDPIVYGPASKGHREGLPAGDLGMNAYHSCAQKSNRSRETTLRKKIRLADVAGATAYSARRRKIVNLVGWSKLVTLRRRSMQMPRVRPLEEPKCFPLYGAWSMDSSAAQNRANRPAAHVSFAGVRVPSSSRASRGRCPPCAASP